MGGEVRGGEGRDERANGRTGGNVGGVREEGEN